MNSGACSEAVAKFNCFGRSFIKEIMTWNWKSAAAIFPYSEFSQCKSFNKLIMRPKEILGAILFVFNFLACWLINTQRIYMNIQSKTTTIGKATIVVKDKPSSVTNTFMLQVSLIFAIKLRTISVNPIADPPVKLQEELSGSNLIMTCQCLDFSFKLSWGKTCGVTLISSVSITWCWHIQNTYGLIQSIIFFIHNSYIVSESL